MRVRAAEICGCAESSTINLFCRAGLPPRVDGVGGDNVVALAVENDTHARTIACVLFGDVIAVILLLPVKIVVGGHCFDRVDDISVVP